MNLDEESLKLLNDYLVKILAPITQADPSVLANYVKALLLKKDKSGHEFRQHMIQQLETFLKEQTEMFVDHILEVMKNVDNRTLFQQNLRTLLSHEKSLISSPNNTKRSSDIRRIESSSSISNHNPPHPSSSSGDVNRSRTPSPHSERQHSPSPSSRRFSERRRGRKRERDRDNSEEFRREKSQEREREREREQSSEDRSTKKQRKESPPVSPYNQQFSDDEDERRKTFDTRRTESPRQQQQPQHISVWEGEPRGRSTQRRGGGGSQRRGRGRSGMINKLALCRDFMERGMCPRGEKCPYRHVTETTEFNLPSQNIQPLNIITPSNYQANFPVYAPPYIPEVTLNLTTAQTSTGYPSSDSQQITSHPSATPFNNLSLTNLSTGTESTSLVEVDAGNSSGTVTPKQQTEKRGRRAYRAHGGYRARSEKQGSSKSAGSLQPSNRESTTIDIVNIPLELNTIDKLHEHFKKFGQIINIQVMPDKGKAQIQFSTKTEARAAMRSTEAVLNNRFIKIYWAREQKETDVTEQKKATEELKLETSKVASPSPSIPQDSKPTRTLQLHSEEFEKKKQERIAMKKALEEKKKELQKQRQQFIKKQQELLDNLIKLSKRENLSKNEKENLLKQIQSVSEKLKTAIQEQQKLLQIETTTVDPQSPSTPPPNIPPKSALTWVAPKESSFLSSSSTTMPSIFTSQPLESTSTLPTSSSTDTVESTSPPLKPQPSSPTSPSLSNTNEKNSTTEILKQKVETLRQQVKESGLVPPTTKPSSISRGSFFSFTTRWRPLRGRFRTLGRGRGRMINPLVLDHRTTQIRVHDLPSDIRDIGILTDHFKVFGEVQSVTLQDNDAIVKMATRKSAEMAISKGITLREHKLHMSWYGDSTTQKSQQSSQKQEQSLSSSTEGVSEQPTGGSQPSKSEDVIEEVIPSHYWESETVLYFGDPEDDFERSWKHSSTLHNNNNNQPQ